jgi:hypothetical protein
MEDASLGSAPIEGWITKNYPSGGQWNLIRKDSDSISVSIAFHQQQILGMQWQERASIALHLSGFPN